MCEAVIDERQLLRVVLNYLSEHKYVESMRCLEKETGVGTDDLNEDLVFFRGLVLDGRWTDADAFLDPLKTHKDFDYTTVRFEMRKQRFLELLHGRAGQVCGRRLSAQ